MADEQGLAQLDIRTVVLVGRQDFGRCPLAAHDPTAMWPLGDRPVLLRLLDHLAAEGITHAVICCGKESAASVEAVCLEAAIDVQVLTEDLTKGTAGCLRDAVASDPGGLLLVMSGSMVSPPSIHALVEAHQANDNAELTMVFNPGPPDGDACAWPAEIYLCSPAVLQHIPLGGYFDIKEGLIPSILRAGGTVRPFVLPAPVGNFHDRRGYLDAVALHLGDGTTEGETLTATSASVHPTARVYGPVAIGERAQLMEDALVVGPAVLGPETVAGPGSAIVGSVLWGRARVGARSEVRQSVVGREAVVPDDAEVVEQSVSAGTSVAQASRWAEVASQMTGRIGGLLSRQTAYVAAALIIGVAFLWSYWPTIGELWRIWQASDEYSAGLLVPFLAIYVVWSRRKDFSGLAVKPAVVSGTALFVLAQLMRNFGLYRMYASAERLSIVFSVIAIVLLLLGKRFLWKLAPVLLFLFLMLPWPNQVQVRIGLPLQRMATNSAVFCLELLGADVRQHGNIIEIGETRVEVAAACNGLRMIMAFIIISGLVALLANRAWWEKMVVLISSLPIALFCNTLRLTVTALLFTVIENEGLEQFSHDFGGYAMMPVALAMMIGLLWLLRRLTTPPVEIVPEVIAPRKPRQVPGS